MKKIHAVILTAMFSAMLLGCDGGSDKKAAQEPVVTQIRGQTMGTFYSVTVPGDFPGGEEALRTLAEKTFKNITDVINVFDENSELSKFNNFKSTEPFVVSHQLANIIQECRHQGRRIDGAMDISVGPLVNLWGFGKDGQITKEPSQEQIDAAMKLVGPKLYTLRENEHQPLLIKHKKEVKLDLNTVGEGLGVDALAQELDKLNIRNYLVSVAGANRSKGLNARGGFWTIGIEDPSTPEHSVFVPVCPLDQAMSTAGSYRNFFKDEQTGKIYSHAIDPKTGRPIDHQTLSVTVIGRSALVTDALDTGLLVWGADRALAWGEKYYIPLYTIELKDGKPVGRYTRAFEKYLKCGNKPK